MKRFQTTIAVSIFLLAIFGILLFKFWAIAISIAGGFLLYFLIDKTLDWFERRGVKGLPAYLILILLFSITLIGLTLFVAIPFFEQTESLIAEFPKLAENFKQELSDLTATFPALEKYQDNIKTKALASVTKALSLTGTMLGSAATMILIAFILLASRQTLRQKFTEGIPNEYFEVTVSIVHKIINEVENFAVAKMVETLIVTILYAFGFWAIGLPMSLLFGVVGGLLNIIPYIGPIIAAVPVAIAAYLYGGYTLLIASLIVMAIGQLIDNTILQTWLISKFVDVHPLTVVIITLIAAEVAGVAGMVIAIPVYSIAKLLTVGLYDYLKSVKRHEILLREEESYNKNNAGRYKHKVKPHVFGTH